MLFLPSISILIRMDCSWDSNEEIFRFAIHRDQPPEENQDIIKSDHIGSLMLTLFYRDPEVIFDSVWQDRMTKTKEKRKIYFVKCVSYSYVKLN